MGTRHDSPPTERNRVNLVLVRFSVSYDPAQNSQKNGTSRLHEIKYANSVQHY